METDEKIVKKMVNDIADSNASLLSPQSDSKFGKMLPALLKKGIESLNLSMFSDDLRFSILT